MCYLAKGILLFQTNKVELKDFIFQIADKQSMILDFFSGSATTAHAVMQLNAEDGGHRKFIMVQLPEKTDESSEAYKAGYPNICEIGKERIRRAGRKIKDEAGLTAQNLDIGFRVLRLDSSNMQDVYYNPAAMTQDLLSITTDNIKPDRTPEDLLFQVMLDLGVELSSPITETVIGGKKVYDVADGFLLACFDTGVTTETVTAIAKKQPYYAVFRDSSMADDSTATNFDQIFETYSPQTDEEGAVMRFRFKIQQYQTDAVESVVRVFSGQPKVEGVSYRRDIGETRTVDISGPTQMSMLPAQKAQISCSMSWTNLDG